MKIRTLTAVATLVVAALLGGVGRAAAAGTAVPRASTASAGAPSGFIGGEWCGVGGGQVQDNPLSPTGTICAGGDFDGFFVRG
ncbi:hypothetical protein ACFRCG_06565 [Embleya sp. NPDC056575]|uniref:hypothetical protein n=1 Tax=unclassified Embleya TaxID=2699296 RepID=UPI003691F5B6